MTMLFTPRYAITSRIAADLMRIEAARGKAIHLPLSVAALASLRETARLHTAHYSTMIEGNRLTFDQVKQVVEHKGHFPGRERDEAEVNGYYQALAFIEQYATRGQSITEELIQQIHALVMAGTKQVPPTPYRTGQNVIRDGKSGRIVYLPPEAADVPLLMAGLVKWLTASHELPCPLAAALTHYQYATIHPYYDGNGRTARLLTTLIIHKGGYAMKGIYALEEYYARDLAAYYEALSVGPSHNYYEGRAEADLTHWLEYFIAGMAFSCEKIVQTLEGSHDRGMLDQSTLIRELDPRQRKAVELFQHAKEITSSQIGALFQLTPRTSAHLCTQWVAQGFLEIADPSKKGRKYQLAPRFAPLIIR